MLLPVGLAAVAVAFFIGFAVGESSGPSNLAAGVDNLSAAEKGKADAQWIVRNHEARGDVSITGTSPVLACDVAQKGVGFIRFYTAQESREYVAACEQEFATLAGP
ncbi:hypothetical protein ABID95_005865 [Streptomyces atratus]|uniref:hypothetical protein n=1 Tax=Streptomyces atratus TaxID=1893 RepID=UPI003390E76D